MRVTIMHGSFLEGKEVRGVQAVSRGKPGGELIILPSDSTRAPVHLAAGEWDQLLIEKEPEDIRAKSGSGVRSGKSGGARKGDDHDKGGA